MTASTDPWLSEDDPRSGLLPDPAVRASVAAGRLHSAAAVALSIWSILTWVGVVALVVDLASTAGRDSRIVIAVYIGSAVVSWLLIVVLCLAAQAFARYVEMRADR